MLNYIKKSDNGSVIDVDAMRKDVKNDPRFFNKKQGSFTRSGKERLAAIEEISSVQDKGLKYNIHENNTFDIVDKTGKTVDTIEGKGVETGKHITPFYGMINKEKRSKKEVSSILGENIVDKPSTRNENIVKTSSSTTVKTESKKDNATPEKLGSSLLQKAKDIIKGRKKDVIKTSELTATSKTPSQEDVKKAELAEKIKGELPKEESNPRDINYQTTPATENKEEESELDKVIKGALMVESSSNPVVQREAEVLKSKISNILNSDIPEEEVEEIVEETEPTVEDNKQKLKKRIKGQVRKTESHEQFSENDLQDYKKYKQIIFNEKIKDLDSAIKAIEENVSFSPEKKEESKVKISSAKAILEKMRSDFANKNDKDLTTELIEKFGNRVSVHKKGNVVKFQEGGLADRVKSATTTNRNFLRDEDLRKKQEEEERLAFEEQQRNKIYQQDFGPQDNPNKFIWKQPGSNTLESDGSMIVTPGKKNSSGVTQNPAPKKVGSSEKNVLSFLNSYKPSGLGVAMGGTLAKWAIARQALKDPVTIVKPLQSVYTEHGSRNVQAARDIDASSIQAAKNDIAGMHTRYKGSDPILSVLLKKADQKEKMDKTLAWIDKRATYRRGEEDRVNLEMEEKRLQGAEDLQNITKNSNLNKEYQYKADLQNAENLAKRKSDIAAVNIAGVEEGTKTLSGWLGDRRAVDDQFKSDLAAKVIAGEQSKLDNKLAHADKRMRTAQFYMQHGTEQEKALAREQYTKASEDYDAASEEISKYDASSKIVSTKDEIDNPIFNLLRRRKTA